MQHGRLHGRLPAGQAPFAAAWQPTAPCSCRSGRRAASGPAAAPAAASAALAQQSFHTRRARAQLAGAAGAAAPLAGNHVPAPPDQPPAAAAATSQASLPPCQEGDIIRGVAADAAELFLEVVGVPAAAADHVAAQQEAGQPPPQQQQPPLQLAHQGVLYSAGAGGCSDGSSDGGGLQLQPRGWQLQPDSPLVQALPGWPAALQQQRSKQQLPQRPLALRAAEVVYSAARLRDDVRRNPALWRDGTGPADPPLQGLAYATLAAGELEALLCGARGVVMLQLAVGWDAGAPQPISNPLVLAGLRRALGNKGVSVFMSPAPGGLGLSAILAAKAEPFRPWAAHLASFGAQAALVADSPYYKLLIGRVLGYKEAHINHHIQSTSGRQHPSPEVVAAVDKQLAKLSKKRPSLPWKAEGQPGGGGRRQQQAQQQARRTRR